MHYIGRAVPGLLTVITPETKVLNTNRINIVISAMMDEKTSRGENPRNSHSSKQKAKLPKAV
jgi:hypothetical protein